jgi:nucleoside-diphosphate-sugar epimerase
LDLRGESVLITGAAGFIGSHLAEALLASRGAHVRALDKLSTGGLQNLVRGLDRIQSLEGDIRDQETCRRACRLVFHEAALGSVPQSLADTEGTESDPSEDNS